MKLQKNWLCQVSLQSWLVELPEGVKLRKSEAGPQNWANGTTPQGGGIQYEIIGDRNNEWFKPLFDNIDDFFK